MQLIDQFGLYVDRGVPSEQKTNTNQIQARVGKWVLRYVQEQALWTDMRFPLLVPLLSMMEGLDRGAPLEWLLKMLLLFALTFAGPEDGRGSRFPTMFVGSCIEINVFRLDRVQPVSFVPGVAMWVR